MPDAPSSELDTAIELLHRRLGTPRTEARLILLLLIPWLIKRHKRLS